MRGSSKRPRQGIWTRKDRLAGVESLFEASGRGGLSAWREGVVLALLPVLYGVFPLISGHITLRGRGGGQFRLDDGPARAWGLAAIALGFAIHVRFFWSSHETLSEHHGRGMLASAVLFLGAVAYIVFPIFG